LREASGKEVGANKLWTPGGKAGNIREAIFDGIPKTGSGVSSKVVKNR